jgi:hypothetical protein
MKRQNRKWRLLCRLAGVLLLLLGLFSGYWWFYKLGPSRRTLDPQWVFHHSQQEHWREVQKGIHRGMWFHDDGFDVGMYGDKPWAEWIMNHVTPGTRMGCFGEPCHSATAMRFLTNQDVGEDADAWLDWWEKNKSKSQEEWIADGFAERGFKIGVPPTPDQTPRVLTLLGDSDTNESTAIPQHMKYNAFRCLRDSSFDPVGFVLSNRAASADIERGLLEYAKLYRRCPEAIGLGILPFAKQDEGWGYDLLPKMLTPWFQIVAYTLVFAPLVLGSALVVWSFRRRKRHVEPRLEPCRDHGDGGNAESPPGGSGRGGVVD